MQRRAAEESLTDHGKDDSNGRAHVGDAIRHKPEMLGFLRQIGFMGATGIAWDFTPSERAWIKLTVKKLIRRAAEVAEDPNQKLPTISMANLPSL